MLKYKVRTYCSEGLPIGQVVARRARLGYPTSLGDLQQLEEKEIVMEPQVYIFVYNCRPSLVAEFETGGGRSEIAYYPYSSLPHSCKRALYKDVEAQGALTWSGAYNILSKCLWRHIASKKFQKWLRKEAKALGLEIIVE